VGLLAAAGLLLLGLGPGCSEPPAPREPFVRQQVELAAMVCGRETCDTILEVNGGGVALFDADDDGDLDIALVIPGAYPAQGATSGGSNRLYRNDGDFSFVDVTAGSGVDVPGFCNGVAVGDVNRDGRRDLYLTRHGPNVLLRNEGGMRFTAVDEAGGAAGTSWSTSALFVDGDRDGDPDLYVTNYLAFDPDDPPLDGHDGRSCRWKGLSVMCGPEGLPAQGDRYYRNDGGVFVDATGPTGFVAPASYGLGCIDGDFDGDGWPDVYVTNDSMPNFLFMNRGKGVVEESAMLAGAALSVRGREQAGMGLAAADTEGDGDEDLLVTNFSMEANALYVNQDGKRFSDRSGPSGVSAASLPLLGWGATFVDADLDGDVDLVTANGHVYPQADAEGTDTSWAQPDLLLLNDGSGRFEPRPWAGEAPSVSRAIALGDLDDDGISDLVVLPRSGDVAVYRGTGLGGASVQVDLEGPAGNPDGVGTLLRLTDELGTRVHRVRVSNGYQAMGDPRAVFAWRGVGTLEVVMPDGQTLTRAVARPGPMQVRIAAR
jgi:hypothetical protein